MYRTPEKSVDKMQSEELARGQVGNEGGGGGVEDEQDKFDVAYSKPIGKRFGSLASRSMSQKRSWTHLSKSIFVSPIGSFLKNLASRSCCEKLWPLFVLVFTNDFRPLVEAREGSSRVS